MGWGLILSNLILFRKEYINNLPRGQRIPYEENHRVNKNGEIEKKCSVCEEWILMNEENYYRNKKNKTDGFYPACKRCEIKRTQTVS